MNGNTLKYYFTFKGRVGRLEYIIAGVSSATIAMAINILTLLFTHSTIMNVLYYVVMIILLNFFFSFTIRRMHDINRPVKIFAMVIMLFISLFLISIHYQTQAIQHNIISDQISDKAKSLPKKVVDQKSKKINLEVFVANMDNTLRRDDLLKKAKQELQKSNDYMLTSKMFKYDAIMLTTIFYIFLSLVKSYPEKNKHGYPAEIPELLYVHTSYSFFTFVKKINLSKFQISVILMFLIMFFIITYQCIQIRTLTQDNQMILHELNPKLHKQK